MSQKLFIPNLGTLIMLAEDWTFKLYFERRNDGMLQVFGAKKGQMVVEKCRITGRRLRGWRSSSLCRVRKGHDGRGIGPIV